MARVLESTIHAGRSVTRNYQKTEYSIFVKLTFDAGDDPKAELALWRRRIQREVDVSVGDISSPHSFAVMASEKEA